MCDMRQRLLFVWMICLLVCLCSNHPIFAAERDAEAAMQAAQGEIPELADIPRPDHLIDFTKGEVMPPVKKVGVRTLNLGPTGIVGIPNGWYEGDQIQVAVILPGSPAEGKLLPGDVVLGVAGNDFTPARHLGVDLGNAIIRAEEESGKGRLDLHIWRDLNYTKRGAPKDMLGVDLDDLFAKANEPQLYEWQEEEERDFSVNNEGYDEFPIVGMETNITLQLEVMGTYSATSPWKCPVAEKIREDALKVVANEFTPSENRRVRKRPNWPGVLALVGSGKPEYIALAKSWVHKQDKFTQDMNLDTDLRDMPYRGMQSWATGFDALEQAIYYDATGDEFVLPEIRKRAIWAAMGQNGGGSWGHTFSFPEFNGGELHKRNPGYGGMNNAGTRCFFLLTLAKKFGIEHPEIDDAIERATRFFGTYIDKGCIPYGYHPPWPSDDSNGKNYGATYAFHVLGNKYAAKFFAMHSANAAFSRRGGHGSATLWYYTPFSSFLAGPKPIMLAMRNMRWFYTLARRHDGSFVFQGKQAGINGENKGMRAATATHAMYYSVPLQKLIITGKDADKRFWMDDEDISELLLSARGQFTDPLLLKASGKPLEERSTDDLIDMLDHFYPNIRRSIAKELGKRFNAGENDIIPKVVALLSSTDARAREGACYTLTACGSDHVLANLSKIASLLDDPAEFVRMTAVKTMSMATDVKQPGKELELLLKAAVDDYDGITMDHGNVRTAVKNALFGGKKQDVKSSALYSNPFQMGFDPELVRSALENIITLDPSGALSAEWTRDTVIGLAGPVVHVASEMQMNDAMFAGPRQEVGKELLKKYGYREFYEADLDILRKRVKLDRDMRIGVEFLHRRKLGYLGYVTISALKENPSAYVEHLPAMIQWLQDEPLTVVNEGEETSAWLGDLVTYVQDHTSKEKSTTYLRDDVFRSYTSELAKLPDVKAKVAYCRKTLANPKGRDYFRKLAAITHVKDMLGENAIPIMAPYFGHDQWRIRELVHDYAVDLVQAGALDQVVALLSSRDENQVIGVLEALADAGDSASLKAVGSVLKHTSPKVRGAAIQAAFRIAGDRAFDLVFRFLDDATKTDDFMGVESALLSRKEDPSFRIRVSEEAVSRLPGSSVPVRRSLAWLLAQIGGAENLKVLQLAAAHSDDKEDIENIVRALSLSPDQAANEVLIAIAEVGRLHLDIVAKHSYHRMIGPEGLKSILDRERVDFAREILNRKLDKRMIQYLSRVYTGRSIQLLFEVMQKSDQTNLAATSIIGAAEGMKDPPADEAQIATDALTQVIEFIEVNYLRGGMQAHMSKEDNYLGWKNLQARAGKVLLKVHKPQETPVPTFDDMDLDF